MANSETDSSDERETGLGRFLPVKPRTLLIAMVLLAAGVTARRVWDGLHAQLVHSPRYRITSEVIHTTPDPLPPWIRTDVKEQVLRDSDITQSLTLLDKPSVIHQRLVDAFELHPWVRHVKRVELAGTRRIDIDLEYREPVAVAEVTSAGKTEKLPIDELAVRLPDGDLTSIEKDYLPRISSIEGRPIVGGQWNDERVVGAARIAARLRKVWETYGMFEIVPSSYPEVQRSHRFYVYEVRTNYGTMIRWGAAPGMGPPGESSFDDKLARLVGFIERHGPLDSINSPQAIDVRDTLHIEKRTVQRVEPDDIRR